MKVISPTWGNQFSIRAFAIILEKLQNVNNRVDGLETLTKNLKDDYLTFKNGDTKNRVELIVNDRVNEIKRTENPIPWLPLR